MSPILVLLSICVSNLPFLPRPKVQCPGMQLPATATHNRIYHIYSTYTIHSCSIMAGGYCCVQTALLALSESNPSEKKKNSLGGDTINDPGSRDFPACTAIFGIRFPEREPRLVLPEWEKLLGCYCLQEKVLYLTQSKSNQTLNWLSHFKEISFKSTKKLALLQTCMPLIPQTQKNRSQRTKCVKSLGVWDI